MNVEIRRQVVETTHDRVELPGLLAMRCYAAMMIVVFHLVALPKLALPNYLWFIPTHFGFGVPLFYTVSAFGLFVGYSEKLRTRQDLRTFYIRRFARIAPLFYVMMVFYIPFTWIVWTRAALPSLSQFASSGLFIFNFVPAHVSGFVMASWSIGVEMAFYAIVPLLIFAITGVGRAGMFLALSAFLAWNWNDAFSGTTGQLAMFGQLSLVSQLPYFAGGIFGYHVWQKLRDTCPWVGRFVLAASVIAVVSLVGLSNEVALALGGAVKLTWALAITAIVVGVALHPQRWFVNPTAKRLGHASFSIYLWHPVVIVTLMQTDLYQWASDNSGGTLLPLLLSLTVTLVVLVPLSLMSFRFIERPGMEFGKRVGGRRHGDR